MPYVDKEARIILDAPGAVAESPGQLNYLFSKIIKSYLDKWGESYQIYNDVIGALEGCKLELYRRRVASYEDEKRWKNGDVWDREEHEAAVDTWGKVLEK